MAKCTLFLGSIILVLLMHHIVWTIKVLKSSNFYINLIMYCKFRVNSSILDFSANFSSYKFTWLFDKSILIILIKGSENRDSII